MSIAGPVVPDNPQVSAELERMLTLGPAHIVHQIMHGHRGQNGGGETPDVIQPTEVVVIGGAKPTVTKTLANKAIAQVVHHRAAEERGVPDKNTFAVVGMEVIWRLAGELRRG